LKLAEILTHLKVPAEVPDTCGERVPGALVECGAVLPDAIPQSIPELIVTPVPARNPHDPYPWRKPLFLEIVVKCGYQFALGQIP
jgi:hypothetical protein